MRVWLCINNYISISITRSSSLATNWRPLVMCTYRKESYPANGTGQSTPTASPWPACNSVLVSVLLQRRHAAEIYKLTWRPDTVDDRRCPDINSNNHVTARARDVLGAGGGAHPTSSQNRYISRPFAAPLVLSTYRNRERLLPLSVVSSSLIVLSSSFELAWLTSKINVL